MRRVLISGLLSLLVGCGDSAGDTPQRPRLLAAGTDGDVVDACFYEGDVGRGTFRLKNDATVPMRVQVSASLATARPSRVPRFDVTLAIDPGRDVEVPFSVAPEDDVLTVHGYWDDGWMIRGDLTLRKTLDEGLIDIEPAGEKDNVIGAETAKLVVRNRGPLEAAVDLEVDRALDVSTRALLLPKRSEGIVDVEVIDASQTARVWYDPHVARIRGASCRPTPAVPRTSGLSRFVERRAVELSAGRAHTCARSEEGEVACWGDNSGGELGVMPKTGVDNHSADPVLVAGLAGRADEIVSGAEHSCVRIDGRVQCWGFGEEGQLGPNAVRGPSVVTDVPLPARALRLHAGESTTCATLEDARTLCWGRTRLYERGDATPAPLPGIALVKEVAFSEKRFCVLAADDALWCWGDVPGNGAFSSKEPVLVSRSLRNVTATRDHTCAVSAGDATTLAGSVVCWGYSADASRTGSDVPQVIPTDGEAPFVLAGGAGVEICRVGATTRCGRPFGNASEVFEDARVSQIVMGETHWCASLSGKVKCFGRGTRGEIGTKTLNGFVAGFGL